MAKVGYKGLRGNYQEIQGVTMGYGGLQRVKGVIKGYRRLQGVTGGYEGWVTGGTRS